MEIWNYIQSIPGPKFLGIYAVFAAVVITLGVFWRRTDRSSGDQMTMKGELPAVVLAYLEGGLRQSVICAVFNLWKNSLVFFQTNDLNMVLVKRSDEQTTITLTGAEMKLLDFLKVAHQANSLPSRNTVRK